MRAGALLRLLGILALALLALHTALAIVHYRVQELPWLLLQLFDLDEENNLPTWFSSFLLLLTAAFLWLCAAQERAEASGGSGHWTALAVGFLLLSIDEVAGVHETINSVIQVTWAIPGGILALGIGFAFVPFLLRLPRRTALLFVLAGALYLAGGAGMEVYGNELVRQRLRDTLQYKLASLVEEGLEIGGVLLFLHALLGYLGGSGEGSVRGHWTLR